MPYKYRIALAIILPLLFLGILNAPFFIRYAQYEWSHPTEDAPVKPDPRPTSSSSTSQLPACKEANYLWIPSLDIDAPIKYVDQTSESVFQRALQDGVVHYPGTALPGELGNVYIFGHSSDLVWTKGAYKTVFAVLPEIKQGASIIVTDGQGRAFTYKVTGTQVVPPNATWVLNQYEHKQKILTLQTSYPIGTALKRFIVLSEASGEPTPCTTSTPSTKP